MTSDRSDTVIAAVICNTLATGTTMRNTSEGRHTEAEDMITDGQPLASKGTNLSTTNGTIKNYAFSPEAGLVHMCQSV